VQPRTRPLLIGRGWLQAVALVFVFGFLVLGLLAYGTYTGEAPFRRASSILKDACSSRLATSSPARKSFFAMASWNTAPCSVTAHIWGRTKRQITSGARPSLYLTSTAAHRRTVPVG